jgi:hypothetical protein
VFFSFVGVTTNILKSLSYTNAAVERLANSRRVNHFVAGFCLYMGICLPGFGIGVWPLCTPCNFMIAFVTQVIKKLRVFIVA